MPTKISFSKNLKQRKFNSKIFIVMLLFIGIITSAQETSKKDTAKTKDIKEITMTKKVFLKKADRFVYDVANSPIAKGNTAYSLLKETPLVSTSDDKTLKILGKNNVVIYIDGRKSTMNNDAVIEMLKNTPAENISKIEVITVPGSEYNVEASEGIINIVLKKKIDDGVNGNIRMANEQGYYNQPFSSYSLNYRKNKLGISTNINGSDEQKRKQYLLKNGNSASSNVSTGFVRDPNLNLGGYINMDYALTDKQNLAINWNNFNNKSYNSISHLFNTINNNVQNTTNYNTTINKEDARSYNNSVNLNYELKTDSLGSKLNLNMAYLNFKRYQRNTNSTYFSDINQNIFGLMESFNQRTPQIINNFAGTVDYVKKFKKDLTISAGGNISKTKTDNDTYLENLNLTTNQFIKDNNQSNHFVYNETISGIYANAEKKFSDKFSGKIGLRTEFTNSLGKILETDISVARKNTNFLPFLNFNYDINDKNNISYSFSSRVRRPSFWEINPVRIYLTPTNYVQNNPFVKASAVYNNEITYMYKQSYFLVISDSYAKDDYSQIPLQKTVNGVTTLRYIRTNFGNKNEFSATVGTQKSFYKNILTINTNIGIQANKINGFLDTDPITGEKFDPFTINTQTYSLLVQSNNTIRLSSRKDWFLSVNYFYVGPQILNIGVLKPLSSLDISIKKIWNDWTFNLEFNDILRNNIVKIIDTQSTGNYNYVMNNQYNRNMTLSITYNFGNQKLKKIRQVENANKDIKSRTR